MYLKNKDLYISIALVFFYSFFSLIVFLILRNGLNLMLAWNIFLAFLPFLFMKLYDSLKTKDKLYKTLLIIFWLLFFPNTYYVITDFIYLNSQDFIIYSIQYEYIMDFKGYLMLFQIFIGVIISLYFGLVSLLVLYKYIMTSKWKKYKNLIVIIISILTGLGIYIGRFFRYNSWDILKFWKIFQDLINSINLFTLFFITMISIIQLLIFFLYYNHKISK